MNYCLTRIKCLNIIKVLAILLLAGTAISGCSKSPQMAKLAAKLYDQYHEHFLDIREPKANRLVIYYQIDIKKYSAEFLYDKALKVARFAYRHSGKPASIQSIEIYMQTIGAPTRINEPDAQDYQFNTLMLEGNE